MRQSSLHTSVTNSPKCVSGLSRTAGESSSLVALEPFHRRPYDQMPSSNRYIHGYLARVVFGGSDGHFTCHIAAPEDIRGEQY